MNAATLAIPTMIMSALSAATCGGGHSGQRTKPAAEAVGAPTDEPSRDRARDRDALDALKWDGKAKSLEIRTMNAAVRATPSSDDVAHVIAHVIRRDHA